jgi:translocation and assembly module TamB
MRRAAKWIGWTLAGLVGLIVLIIVVVLIGANTPPGRRLTERLVADVSGGTMHIEGLAGRFPDKLRAAHVELSDAKGTYTTIDNLAVDWEPLKLFTGLFKVDSLTADEIAVSRLPESSAKNGASQKSSSSSLPVRVEVDALRVARLHTDAPVAGRPYDLSLEGSAELDSTQQGKLHLEARNLAGSGTYLADAAIGPSRVHAAIKANETAGGVISSAAGLPDLGAINIDATLDGPRDAVATQLAVTAGQLRANAQGTIDLVHEAADLTATASAPAMKPRPDISWQSIALNARVHGPFDRIDANGTLQIEALELPSGGVGRLDANVAGNQGAVRLHASLDGLRVTGPKPDLFAAAPLVVDATVQMQQPGRPVQFTVRHPLLQADGSARTQGVIQATAELTLPDLAPLAAAAGTDLDGHAKFDVNGTMHGSATRVGLQGVVAVTGGKAPVPALLGDDAHITLDAAMNGSNMQLDRLVLNGKTLDVSAAGAVQGGAIGLDWTVALLDLAAIQPTIDGALTATGHIGGTQNDMTVDADLAGEVAAQGVPSGPLTAHVSASGLPHAPEATVTAQGTLLQAPLDVALSAKQDQQGMHVSISRAEWKSLHAQGDMTLPPGATMPVGTLRMEMARLADLAPLLGKPVAGQVSANLDSTQEQAKLAVDVKGASLPGTASVKTATLNATIENPESHPVINGTMVVEGVSAGTISGNARAEAHGPADAVQLKLSAASPSLAGAAAKLDAAGTLDAMAKKLALAAFQADWKGETLRLLQPVQVAFANGISIDKLRLGLHRAVLEMSGHVGSTLDLTASLRDLPADIAAVVKPDMAADGVINANARITGTSARPEGTVRLTATGVKLRQGPGQALPPANLRASADLHGTDAGIDARLTAGSSRFALTGTAPLTTTGAMDLHSTGSLDLAMLDPILLAQGERVRGRVTMDANITGTQKAPKVNGVAKLANGDVQDFAMGAHITNMFATVEANGDTIRIARFTGKAGDGTIGASGTVGLADLMPVDLKLTANNAKPLASDLMSAVIDANLYLRGEMRGQLAAGGLLHVRRADINIPSKLPSSVAVLPVRLPGQPPPPPPAPPPDIALDLTLDAPRQIYIRGRGIDVELGGKVHLGGTMAKPLPNGGLKLIRGTMSLAGQTLNFTEGSIDFTGGGISNPSILLVATSQNGNFLAKLTVSGSAKDPKITLSSVPEAPQDEVLAQLLFKRSTSDLSPLELASIAAGLAELSGVTSGVGGPLAGLRNSLGLSRLSVGSSPSGAPSVEAGRYVAPGVYVGARQSATGNGSEATVQVDLAKGLKLETTAGSTSMQSPLGSATTGEGASVGLKYQFEY